LPFYKVTYNTNGGIDRACIYNQGCNFRCRGCAYKLRASLPAADHKSKKIELDEIMSVLARLRPKRVHFLGGEPTTNADLPELARFAHEELGAVTKLGHTNGSGRVPDFIDEAAFSIKAYTGPIHEQYTGAPNGKVLSNFADAYQRGIGVTASTVLIPGVVDAEEVGRVAGFVGGIERRIRFHITAYMPVPGVPYPAPTPQELFEARAVAQERVEFVSCRALSSEDYIAMRNCEKPYMSVRVA
jgi:pyruvate formate lyase activating enzyme